ncbi:hypothetical protein HDU96_006122 [Phlyctochytrium bullatum]|nr:hypothetical protein HDU96_006122 [Phlyctochytrium bullatum]
MHLKPPCIPENVPPCHIRHLHEKFRWLITEQNAYQALKHGPPEELKYCLTQVRYLPPSRTFEHIAKNPGFSLDHLKVLMDAFGDDDGFWEPRCIDDIIRVGSLETIEFLYGKRQERCTAYGLQYAAERGDAQMFKFLEANDSWANPPLGRRSWARIRRHEDVARYLYDELGLPITEAPRYDTLPSQRPILFLMNLDQFGYECSDDDLSTLLIHACHCGTLEQIERFSKRTPECREAYLVATRVERLDVLRFLLKHRSEEPDVYCFRAAVEKPVEFVRFFFEEAGMTVDVDLLEHASCAGRLDVVKYIVDLLPADARMDGPISKALYREHFEVAKFLHLKRRALWLRLPWSGKSSMDVVTFVIEHYADDLEMHAVNSVLVGNPPRSFDTFKYVVEGRHYSYTPSWSYTHEDPDLLRYVMTRKLVKVDREVIESAVFLGHVCILRILVQAMPEAFQRVFHRFDLRSLPALAFIRAKIPHAVTAAQMTKIISYHLTRTDSPYWFVANLQDLYPDCVLPEEHVTMAAQSDTITGLLLWEKAWTGGCPAKAMVAACQMRRYCLLKKFLEKMDMEDLAWRTALEVCVAVAQKDSTKQIQKTVEEALALFQAKKD